MKKRVLSGNRPTGRLHLGHLHGALSNWVRLQEEYECFYFVADWHALTTKFDDTSALLSDTRDMVLDWIAAGLDPDKSVIYRQSDVPEVAELNVYFSMITPLGWLERTPSYKEMIEELGTGIMTHGFLGYPVLQAADILIVHGDFVPVGEDQQAHVELTREIARRFNHLYGDYFGEPQTLLTETKRIPGVDGRKMSKSYGNAIYLSDSSDEVARKVRTMITDPKRVRKGDPGRPEVCSVYALHLAHSLADLSDIEEKCRSGERGCVECKEILSGRISEILAGLQAKRVELEDDPELVEKVLAAGCVRARAEASATLHEVRTRVRIE